MCDQENIMLQQLGMNIYLIFYLNEPYKLGHISNERVKIKMPKDHQS